MNDNLIQMIQEIVGLGGSIIFEPDFGGPDTLTIIYNKKDGGGTHCHVGYIGITPKQLAKDSATAIYNMIHEETEDEEE